MEANEGVYPVNLGEAMYQPDLQQQLAVLLHDNTALN